MVKCLRENPNWPTESQWMSTLLYFISEQLSSARETSGSSVVAMLSKAGGITAMLGCKRELKR